MKTKRYFKTMLVTMAVSGLCLQTLVSAQDTSQAQPAYSSAVKAGQAAQVAKQEAMTTNSSLQAALTQVEKAEDQMSQLQMSDDQHQKMSAEMTLNNAEDNYVGLVSKMSGVSEKDISDMHTAGVGWADVPGELGMHGMIGHKMNSDRGSMGKNGQGSMTPGSMMASRKAEVIGATARDTKSGMTKGHGTGMQTDVHGNRRMASGAGGLGNGMGSGEMGDHDNGMSGNMGGGMGGGSGSGGSSGSGGGSGGSGGSSGSGGGSGGSGGGSGGGGGGGGGMH